MQFLELNELDKYKDYPALAFMNFQPPVKSIIIDIKNQNPLMSLSQLIGLGIKIKKAFIEKGVIALLIDEFAADGFVALESKFILTESFDLKLQKTILRFHQWLIWDETHLYCNKCAGILKQVQAKIEKQCRECAQSFFPTIAPAVMVLIERGNQILMARSPHFR